MPPEAQYHDDDRQVIAIGAAGVDVIGQLEAELQLRTSNPARIRSYFGGVARNVAENLARLGQPIVLLSVLGEDTGGKQLLAHLRESGVETSHMRTSSAIRTGSYLAVIDRSGELAFALDDMHATEEITPTYIRDHKDLFQRARALFVDGNLPPETIRTAFHLARLARIPIYADPTSTALADRFIPYLDRLDLITPNTTEAAIYCGAPVEASDPQAAIQAAKMLVSKGVKLAVITLAEFGVVYATSEVSGHIPALRTEISDPTGAGDALSAAVIFGLLHEMQVDDAVRLGISAAALTLRRPGTVAPDLSLERLYDQLVI